MRSKTVDRLLKTTPKEVEIFVDLYAALAVRINQLLREKVITKKELALKLDKNPSEITKWLSSEHNFTLRSLAKLSAELGEPLLEVPKHQEKIEFNDDGFICKIHTFVSYKKSEPPISNNNWLIPIESRQVNELSNVG